MPLPPTPPLLPSTPTHPPLEQLLHFLGRKLQVRGALKQRADALHITLLHLLQADGRDTGKAYEWSCQVDLSDVPNSRQGGQNGDSRQHVDALRVALLHLLRMQGRRDRAVLGVRCECSRQVGLCDVPR